MSKKKKRKLIGKFVMEVQAKAEEALDITVNGLRNIDGVAIHVGDQVIYTLPATAKLGTTLQITTRAEDILGVPMLESSATDPSTDGVAVGTVYANTVTCEFKCYDGTNWVLMSSAAQVRDAVEEKVPNYFDDCEDLDAMKAKLFGDHDDE